MMELQMCLENEQFSTLSSHQYVYNNYSNDSTNMETIQTFSDNDMYEWDMDKEKELNGDLALIPELSVNSRESINKIIDSPPTVDLHRLMNEIQDYICVDPGNILPIDENFIPSFHANDDFVLQDHGTLGDIFNLPANNSFDLTQYLTDEDPKPRVKSEQVEISERKPRAGVKKIDLKAQKYIVDEDEEIENNSDNKTPTEANDIPVLEACDLLSLLEQFEATQMPDLPQNFLEDNANLNNIIEKVAIKTEKLENNDIVDHVNVHGTNVVKVEEPLIEITDVKLETQISVKKEIKLESSLAEECASVSFKQNQSVPHHPIKAEAESTKKTPLSVGSHKTTTQNQVETFKQTPTGISHKNTIHETEVDIFKQTGSTVASHKTTRHENIQSIPSQEIVPRNIPNTTKIASTCIKEEPAQIQNRKVLNELPQDLISRIKESRKRKTISVIPPIPNKKRGGPKTQEVTQAIVNKSVKPELITSVQLDHDYCYKPIQEQVKKEQSTSSAEEDERAIIMKQPMVKNADGKLMVSLLKVNTIHSNDLTKKKKLGIEEYKRRREGKIKLQGSQNNSASSSSCSSPVPEDENTRILKHQEKLMKMAIEVLNSCPKSVKKQKPTVPVVPPTELQIPSNMEKKTFVSIGVNTEFKICKNLDPVMPVQQLEELKPMLEKASDKFSENSLIKSVIENIPKVINNAMDIDSKKTDSNSEHGEDKTIVYLPKNRIPIESRDMEVQTNITLIQQKKEENRRRRRDSSSSSSSSSTSRHSKRSTHYSRRRQDSDSSSSSSRTSKSSYYNSRSRSASRSRSRSPPPRYSNWEQERIREVEERRVVYVGRISRSTTREHLRDRFQRFGPITNISLHFRDHGYLDNYGFVTFANQYAAFEAIEHANDDPYYPKYDLSFGGRRQFCITTYSDLDNMRDETTYHPVLSLSANSSFDNLLRDAQEKLRRRKF